MLALIKREIQLAYRSGGGFALTLAFFLILVIFVPFAVGSEPQKLASIAPGILWIGALLANLLSLERIFQLDFEDGTLDALATSPIPLPSIAFAKAIAHWLTTSLPLSIAAIPLAYLLNMPSENYFWLTFSLLSGSPALSFIGTFGAALTIGIRRGGLLLSLLVLPLYIPSLIFGALAVNGINQTSMLALVCVISLLSMATLPIATGYVLRANLR